MSEQILHFCDIRGCGKTAATHLKQNVHFAKTSVFTGDRLYTGREPDINTAELDLCTAHYDYYRYNLPIEGIDDGRGDIEFFDRTPLGGNHMANEALREALRKSLGMCNERGCTSRCVPQLNAAMRLIKKHSNAEVLVVLERLEGEAEPNPTTPAGDNEFVPLSAIQELREETNHATN